MEKPGIVTYFDISKQITCKVSTYKTREIEVELTYWTDTKRKSSKKLCLDDSEAKWLAKHDQKKDDRCYKSIVKDYSPGVWHLVLNQIKTVGEKQTMNYWGTMEKHCFERYRKLINDVQLDIAIMSPYFWKESGCENTYNMAVLSQILFVLGYRHYTADWLTICNPCLFTHGFNTGEVIENECNVCNPENQFEYDRKVIHVEKCVSKYATTRRDLAEEVIKKIEPYQLAFTLFINNINSEHLYFTFDMDVEGVNIDNIVGGSLYDMSVKYANKECFFPITMELVRRATIKVLRSKYDKECQHCGVKDMQVHLRVSSTKKIGKLMYKEYLSIV